MKAFAKYIGNTYDSLLPGHIYLIDIKNLASEEYLEPLGVNIDDIFRDTYPDYKDFNKYWEII